MTFADFKTNLKILRDEIGTNPLKIINVHSIADIDEYEYEVILTEIKDTVLANEIREIEEDEAIFNERERQYALALKEKEEKEIAHEEERKIINEFDDLNYEDRFIEIELEQARKREEDAANERYRIELEQAELKGIQDRYEAMLLKKAEYDKYNIGFLNEINALRKKRGHEIIFYEDIFNELGEPRWYPNEIQTFEVMIYDAAVREIFDAVAVSKKWYAKDPASITFGYSYVNAPRVKGGNYIRAKTNLNQSKEWKKAGYEFTPLDELAAMSYEEFKKLKGWL